MDLEKLADEISKLYQTPGLTLKQAHALVARHVALMVLEARKDELEQRLELDDVAWIQWRNDLEARIKVIEAEITKLTEG